MPPQPSVDDDDAFAATPRSPYRAEVPADHRGASRSQRRRRFESRWASNSRSGEIDIDEYESQREELETERQALNTATLKATLAAEMIGAGRNQCVGPPRWPRSCRSRPGAIYQSKSAGRAFDAIVRDLVSEEAIKANPDRQRWTRRRILIEADKQFRADMGLAAPAAGADADKPLAAKDKVASALKARRDAATDRVTTLRRDAPAADQEPAGKAQAPANSPTLKA
jgi:hypothetical protein